MPFDMTHLCESCRRHTDLFHCKSVDEYLCEDCIIALAKRTLDELTEINVTPPKEEPEVT